MSTPGYPIVEFKNGFDVSLLTCEHLEGQEVGFLIRGELVVLETMYFKDEAGHCILEQAKEEYYRWLVQGPQQVAGERTNACGCDYEPGECDADLDCNGVVNNADLNLFMGVLFTFSFCGDMNVPSDGYVGPTDLLFFLASYGTQCP